MFPFAQGLKSASVDLLHTARGLYRLYRDESAKRREDVIVGQERYALPRGYVARAKPKFDDHAILDSSGIVWQPDVYELAFRLARLGGAKTVIDVGCGFAGKLVLGHPEFEIVGVDIASNIEHCRSEHPFGTWIPHDFELGLPDLAQHKIEESVVICSDVIEHIVNIEHFLTDLAGIARSARLTVISTPDRTLTRGPFHRGPPPNPCHIREWNAMELKQLLTMYGIEGWFGLTRSENQSDEMKTIISVATGQPRC
jgi:2-polyprenyl-3-methyl-5-hydroxy-6-metoxy-1,4-benzoquinol methylase